MEPPHELWGDDVLLVFDGRVLEVFNFPGSGAHRFHVASTVIERQGPDRKGR